MPETVTKRAVLNICERRDSSRRAQMATTPALICTVMNSNFSLTAAAQTSTMTVWAMKAVRESRKTRMNIGTRHSGSMSMLRGSRRIITAFIMGNMVSRVNTMASDRGLSR